MYLLGAPTEVQWELDVSTFPLAVTDLDMILIDPEGVSSYITNPILAGNFTAPTDIVNGAASYIFTPALEGHYKMRLVKGTSASYQVLSKTDFWVFDNTTVVNPYSTSVGKPAPYDIAYFVQGYMVANELVGGFVATRDIVIDTNAPNSKAIAEVAPSLSDTTFRIFHDNVEVGTIIFTIGSTVGVITINALLLLVDDTLKIYVDSGFIDPSIRDISITIVGCANIVDCTLA